MIEVALIVILVAASILASLPTREQDCGRSTDWKAEWRRKNQGPPIWEEDEN